MNIDAFEDLINKLSSYPRVIIQPHDFPDHDAIASAYGLSHILSSQGLNPIIIYNGHFDRISLVNMIEWLEIPVIHASQMDLTEDDVIVTIDGCIGEKNVTDMPGLEVAVIDHHQVTVPDFVWYQDVRADYGSAATIIVEYFNAFSLPIPKNVASALLLGLDIDTANFTRGFIDADILAFQQLQKIADVEMVNKICRNQIVFKELNFFKALLSDLVIKGRVGYVMLHNGCPKNMLGVLSDFVLSLDEVDVAILTSKQEHGIQLSLRSESENVSAGTLAREVLNNKGIGFGGGHTHMAGGIIKDDHAIDFFENPSKLFSLFLDVIEQYDPDLSLG